MAMVDDSNRMTSARGLEAYRQLPAERRPSMWAIWAFVLALGASPLLVAQQTHSGSECEDDKRLFIANCAPCHGPDGDAIAGIDFGHGKFRRASSDQDLLEMFRGAAPGTVLHAFSPDDLDPGHKHLAGYW